MRTSISRLSALLIVAALLIGGCESDKAVTPVAVPDSFINLYISDQTIFAPAGRDISRPVVAEVITDEGAPVSGIRVSFRLLEGSGRFETTSAVTDGQGIASSILRTTLLRGMQKLTISVSTVSATARRELHFTGTGQPALLSIPEPVEPVVVPPTTPARINLRARLTDANGAAVEGIPLKYSLISWYGGIFGSISGDSLSRKDGSILISFEALGEFGREYIVASTDTSTWKGAFISDTVLIEVRRKVEQTLTFTVRLTPNTVDPLDSVRIGVQAKDENNVGVPNIDIRFTTDFGTLSVYSPTDSAGIASAILKSNGTSGLANVHIWAPGYDFDRTIPIQLSGVASRNRLSIYSDPDFIYAHDSLTVVHLRAVLRDEDDNSISGKEILWGCTQGVIQSVARSDSTGPARADYRHDGIYREDANGHPLNAMIYARCNEYGVRDSIALAIRPANPVSMIALTSNKSQLAAGGGDSASIRATCFTRSGAYAPFGTRVEFEIDDSRGRFTAEETSVGAYGVASTYYLPDIAPGIATMRAKVHSLLAGEDSIVYSNDIEIRLLGDRIFEMTLTCDPPYNWVSARIADQFDHPVRQGELVTFSTDQGDITPSALTDTNGVARARITRGVDPGPIVITARAGDLVRSITIPGEERHPNSFRFAFSQPSLNPPGAGGVSEMTITVEMIDEFGDLFEPPVTVMFQLPNEPAPPTGAHFGNGSSLDSVVTEGGRGSVVLQAGSRTGSLLLRVYSWRDYDAEHAGEDGIPRTNAFSVTFSAIPVVSGPPRSMDLIINEDGDDAGGGTWQILVSARVLDANRNPAMDRIPVVFTVDPQIATIDTGFTGNDVGQGKTNGIAYSWLRYHSVNTGDTVRIRAVIELEGGGTITAERTLVLPLQDGFLSLMVDPQNWMFDRANPNDTATFRVWAVLTDGHGVAINNMPILFRTDRQRFYWRNLRLGGRFIPFFPEAARRYTGLVNAENNEPAGTATVYLRGVMWDAYFDDFTLEVTIHVEASVEGYDIAADPAFIFVTRH